MTIAELYYEPIAVLERANQRLRLIKPHAIAWSEVKRVVADELLTLATRVSALRPGVRSRSGDNQSPAVPLFVYQVFYPEDDDADPIVAGVAFKKVPGGILVRADLCGEESGTIYFEHQDCRREIAAQQDVVAAAREVARRLAREVSPLVEALDRAEPVE